MFGLCQCPRRAILISTDRKLELGFLVQFRVSMPSAGYSHFYISASPYVISKKEITCQCPRRAILISTQAKAFCVTR